MTKGVSNLYEYCCDGKFYEWIFPGEHEELPQDIDQKYICMGPVFYKHNEILTLVEDKFDPIHEEQSTWKIAKFTSGTRDHRFPHRPYKIFQLETDDDLLVLQCKIRPVLAIKKIEYDWRVPNRYFDNTWLCLPLFSYKNRHSQRFVLTDQMLQVPYRFYFPPGNPGLDEECAGLINELQCIPQINLYPKKCFCDIIDPNMYIPIRLSEMAFQAVIGHIAQFLPGIIVSGESFEWYDFFKELVSEEIAKIISA
ncbi:MAG: hypothetical protein ACFFDI_15920 [Promethearchaeota archaeon]